jgi:hypothetical protein
LFQRPSGVLRTTQSTSLSDEGATRMLTQLKHQFDVVQPGSDFEQYALLILPDGISLDEKLVQRLQGYLRRGGKLLASGTSGLSEDGLDVLLPELGIIPQGLSPYTTTYFRFSEQFASAVPPSDHVMYERGVRVQPGPGAQVAAVVVEPYFERAWNHFSSHRQTPPDNLTSFAAALLHGSTAYISYPIFHACAQHGNYPYRLLVQAVLDRLLPNPLLRLDGAPTGLEATVMRQDGQRTIVHLLYYPAERRTRSLDIIEDIIPLSDIHVSLSLPEPPSAVYLAPERTPVSFVYRSGRVELVLPELRGHAMLVFEG